MKKGETVTVSIPSQLAKRIEKRYKKAGFKSMSSYVTYVLRQVISGIEVGEENTLSKKDEKNIKKRLKALGYIE